MEVVNTVFPKYLPIPLSISSPAGPAPSNHLAVPDTFVSVSSGPPSAPAPSAPPLAPASSAPPHAPAPSPSPASSGPLAFQAPCAYYTAPDPSAEPDDLFLKNNFGSHFFLNIY